MEFQLKSIYLVGLPLLESLHVLQKWQGVYKDFPYQSYTIAVNEQHHQYFRFAVSINKDFVRFLHCLV